MSAIITQKNISKTFTDFHGRKFTALHDINLSINEGEFFILLGPSGCGKSTLLRIMSGLEPKFSGSQIYQNDFSMKDCGFVFQQFALLPWLTVEENVSLGLIAKGQLTNKKKAEVAELLKSFGLDKFAQEYPKELSGGMKQRVGIARALAVSPKVIFLDEPFSALDSFTTKTLRQELLDVWRARKITLVMVTHSIEEAIQLGDRIAVMSANPGKLEHIIENTLARPRDSRSPKFFEMVDKLETLVRPSNAASR